MSDPTGDGGMSPIPFAEVQRRMMSDPVYRQAWADSALPMQIAFELCDARERAGITRDEIARQIGVSEAEVAQWEKGSGSMPDLPALRLYAEATGSRLHVTLTPDQADAGSARRGEAS